MFSERNPHSIANLGGEFLVAQRGLSVDEELKDLTDEERGILKVVTSWNSSWGVRKTCEQIRVFKASSGKMVLSLDLSPRIRERSDVQSLYTELARSEAFLLKQEVLPPNWE